MDVFFLKTESPIIVMLRVWQFMVWNAYLKTTESVVLILNVHRAYSDTERKWVIQLFPLTLTNKEIEKIVLKQ